MTNKKKIKAIISFSAFILLIFALIFIYMFKNQDKQKYVDYRTWQIQITYKEINIREEANIESKAVGKVKSGEIYDVISYSRDDTYEWYQIKTSNNIEGWVGSSISNPYVKETGNSKKSDISIKYYNDYVIFRDDIITLDHVECSSSFGCEITYELLDNDYIKYIGTDTLGKSSYKTQKYYMTYSMKNMPFVVGDSIVNITFSTRNDGLYVNLKIVSNKDIYIEDVAKIYGTILNLYQTPDLPSTPKKGGLDRIKTGNLDYGSINEYMKLADGLNEINLKDISYIKSGDYINIDYFIPSDINNYFEENVRYLEFGYQTTKKSSQVFNGYLSKLYVYE